MKKWLEEELKERRQELYNRQYMCDYMASNYGIQIRISYKVIIQSTVCDEYYEEEDVVLSPFTALVYNDEFTEDMKVNLAYGSPGNPIKVSYRMVFVDPSTSKGISDYIEAVQKAEDSLKGICGIPRPDKFKLDI